MRPKLYYAVFDLGRVVAIAHGAATARSVLPGSARPYKAFKTELEAQEFSAWWNYASTKERTFSEDHHHRRQ